MDDKDSPKKPTEEERQVSDFAKAFAEKYGFVFDEPVPDRLADLIERLKEIKSE